MFAKKEVVSTLENSNNLITTIPKPDLKELKIDGKLDNLKKNFKEYQDFSAIESSIKDEKKDVNTNLKESVYSEEEAMELIRLKDSLAKLKERINAKPKNSGFSNPRSNRKSNNEFNNYKKQKRELQKKELTPSQMFAKEMKAIDSLMNPLKYDSPIIASSIKSMETTKPKKISQVYSLKKYSNKYFNTISVDQNKDPGVEALLDQSLVVYNGSRIRIKLQSDIMIDSVKMKKHSYIYGVITGFTQQRILVSITNILVKGKIYDVNMRVYDKDGMPGFYVPSSRFRNFTKLLGSETTNNLGTDQNSEGTQGEQSSKTIALEIAQTISRETTKALSSFIKKNRGHLKYNTHIYLINENN
ncbi:conjugative transposon protein TraM [Tenacibaculum finnmarkense]|uniref:conjugative transposon protein TraM n=1 Tax=Tenacibaculum finnmarkense TaxID=2781243 RepID=UPI001EFAF0F4|nr:conjugative transposon protein TraM [Tenacibaculum finnmarkense]